MDGLVPIVGGLIVGSVLPLLPAGYRVVVAVVGAFFVGALGTMASGEFRVGWEYLLFDVPLAALGMVAGYLAAVELLLPAWARRHRGVDG